MARLLEEASWDRRSRRWDHHPLPYRWADFMGGTEGEQVGVGRDSDLWKIMFL